MIDAKPVKTPGDSAINLVPVEFESVTKFPYQEAASQFNCKHNESHWKALKRVLKYLKGTIETGINYVPFDQEFKLIEYADVDYAADLKTRKSTSGFVVTLGDCPISWGSRLQSIVAQSTTESEYVAIFECAKDVLWYIQLLNSIHHHTK